MSEISFEPRLGKRKLFVQISSALCYSNISSTNVSGLLCARHHGNYYVYSLMCSLQKPKEVDNYLKTLWLQGIDTQLLV